MRTLIGLIAIASQAMVLLAFIENIRTSKDIRGEKAFILWTIIVFMTIVIIIDWIKFK